VFLIKISIPLHTGAVFLHVLTSEKYWCYLLCNL